MTTTREIPPLHEIAKIELKFKFLYFIRDIGIKSAHAPAVETWKRYMDLQAALSVGG